MRELFRNKRKGKKTMELFTSPVLNLFIILIPFLLITAVFVQTSVIDLSLPSGKNKTTSEEMKAPKEKLLILSIAPQGFYLILGEKLLKIIPKEEDTFSFTKLGEILQKVKDEFPEQTSIIIEADDGIIYDHIIHAMDQCRNCGLINISLSASKG